MKRIGRIDADLMLILETCPYFLISYSLFLISYFQCLERCHGNLNRRHSTLHSIVPRVTFFIDMKEYTHDLWVADGEEIPLVVLKGERTGLEFLRAKTPRQPARGID
jgi:hypothetical protein